MRCTRTGWQAFTHSLICSRNYQQRSTPCLSHVIGPRNVPLDERTLDIAWDDIVSRHGDRPALVSRHERGPSSSECLRWTFREFDEKITALARGLQTIGIRKGDRVATWQGNSSANATLQWAAAKLGAILVTLNPAYRLDDVKRCLNLCGARVLFGVPRLRSSNYATMLLDAMPAISDAAPHRIIDDSIPSLRSIVLDDNSAPGESGAYEWLLRDHSGFASYQSLLQHDSNPLLPSVLGNHEIINLQYTSGTTGDPKAVSLTHRNLLNNGLHIGQRMRITERDILINTPPLFHCFGLVLGNLALWLHGGAVVYASETFDPAATLKAVIEERATALHGVPTMFIGILEEAHRLGPDAIDVSSLRTGIAAGSTVPAPLMSRLISSLNLGELVICYGQTESSPVTFQSQTDDPLEKRTQTVGRVMPHVEAKAVDPISGVTLPVGSPGELYVAGYPIFAGYWGNERDTQRTLTTDADGKVWLKTGDVGSLDDEGYLTIRGRLKDLIIRGGENIDPVRIENILLTHTDIAEAAAVAVPDEQYGETVGVFLRRHYSARSVPLDRKAMRTHVRQKYPQAAPSHIWYLGEDDDAGVPKVWPQTASGKIRKVELREIAKRLAEGNIGKVVRGTRTPERVVIGQP